MPGLEPGHQFRIIVFITHLHGDTACSKVEYDETRVEYITSWVPGRLDRLYVDYTGVPVKKGDHMVYLYSPELFAAQEELVQYLFLRLLLV